MPFHPVTAALMYRGIYTIPNILAADPNPVDIPEDELEGREKGKGRGLRGGGWRAPSLGGARPFVPGEGGGPPAASGKGRELVQEVCVCVCGGDNRPANPGKRSR